MSFELETLYRAYEAELSLILDCFDKFQSAKRIPCAILDYDPIPDGCVISLWDAWGRFTRTCILTCAEGPVITLGGQELTPKVARSESEALQHLEQQKVQANAPYSLAFGRRGEPKWYMAKDLKDICDTLELPISAQLSGAAMVSTIPVGAGIELGNPLGDLQKTRNYIAHKSSGNLRKIASLPSSMCVDEYLRSRTSGGSTVFADWVDGLRVIAESSVS